MAQTLGLIDVIWNGTKIDVEKGGKLKLGGLKQNSMIVGQQVDYANEYERSEITVTTRLRRGDSLTAFFTVGAGELQVLCDTGQTYTFPDAFLVDRPEFTAGDGGKIPMKWHASSGIELVG